MQAPFSKRFKRVVQTVCDPFSRDGNVSLKLLTNLIAQTYNTSVPQDANNILKHLLIMMATEEQLAEGL